MSYLPISYERLKTILRENGISIYKLKSDKVIGTATLDKIRKDDFANGNNHIDTRSIESICKYLTVQPGDIMEYVPDSADAPPEK